MTRTSCSAVALLLFTAACSASTAQPRSAATEGTAPALRNAAAEAKAPEPEIANLETHRVGDYYVQRFSGSALDRAYTLSERVTAREGELMVVDYVLMEEGGATERLRVRRRSSDWQIARVSKVDGALERDLPQAAFEALMEKTAFAADSNEAKLSQKVDTCVVGERAYACETARYHVIVDGKPATLSLTTSDTFPGRDVSGSIRSSKGRTIYRAELIEAQQGPAHDSEPARAER